jgi:hypothetical protein
MKRLTLIFTLLIGLAKGQCSYPILNTGAANTLAGQCLDSLPSCVSPTCGVKAFNAVIPAGFDGFVAISGDAGTASVMLLKDCFATFIKDTCIALNGVADPQLLYFSTADTITISIFHQAGASVYLQCETMAGQTALPNGSICPLATSIEQPIEQTHPLIDIVTGQVVTTPQPHRVYLQGRRKLIIY